MRLLCTIKIPLVQLKWFKILVFLCLGNSQELSNRGNNFPDRMASILDVIIVCATPIHGKSGVYCNFFLICYYCFSNNCQVLVPLSPDATETSIVCKQLIMSKIIEVLNHKPIMLQKYKITCFKKNTLLFVTIL